MIDAPLNVLIYGDDWEPSGTWLMGQAYARLGHRVAFHGPNSGLKKYDRLTWRVYRRLFHTVRERDRRAHAAGLVAAARESRADIVIVVKGLLVGPEDVTTMRRDGAWVINYNYDDYFSHFRAGWSHVQRAALPAYDLLVCTKQYNVAEVLPYNPRSVFLMHAYEPRVHRPVPVPPGERDEWTCDVGFVGSWARHRVDRMEALVRAVPAKYTIRGENWNRLSRYSPLAPYVRGTRAGAYGDDLAKATGGAKICLGFLRKENRDDYTTRTFEIPACGGMMLAERTPMHQSLFREGVEAEFFDADNPDELIAKVRALLADDARREAIRDAGMAAVAAGRHTYDDRIRDVLGLYEAHLRHRAV